MSGLPIGRRRLGRAVLSLALVLTVLWLAGLVWFANELDRATPDPTTTTDAIVVLTGGSQRIDSGLTLLLDGKAKKLFVSGVHQGVDTAEMLRVSRSTPQWVQCCVVLGHAADNTVGNAIETAQWLRQEGYHSIRLVTANYHIRRAMLEFRRVLPPDVTIIANPVFPEGARQGNLWSGHGPGRVIVIEYVKYLGALLRPFILPVPATQGPI